MKVINNILKGRMQIIKLKTSNLLWHIKYEVEYIKPLFNGSTAFFITFYRQIKNKKILTFAGLAVRFAKFFMGR